MFRLGEVTTRIKKLLLEATSKRFWVRAQLVVGKRGVRAGHFYCELVEVDGAGRQTPLADFDNDGDVDVFSGGPLSKGEHLWFL